MTPESTPMTEEQLKSIHDQINAVVTGCLANWGRSDTDEHGVKVRELANQCCREIQSQVKALFVAIEGGSQTVVDEFGRSYYFVVGRVQEKPEDCWDEETKALLSEIRRIRADLQTVQRDLAHERAEKYAAHIELQSVRAELKKKGGL